MTKRILFVDDEPMVLQGIRRLLRPMRDLWEIDFAEGGVPATACLAETHYDVVITDMMMPGMDGAQLLCHVRDHSPGTIRLVLSGHAEQHLAMKCIGLAHQYLAKPCDAETLRDTVARVTAPGSVIRNEQVMKLVAQLGHLPSIPAMYSQIVRLLNDPNAALEDVGALIGGDMAMTAKILQLVNSSFFGLARRVSQPAEAASYLGMDTLKALVLAMNVFGQFEAGMPPGFSPEAASEHSRQVGAASRAIAMAEGAPRALADEALVAGLLHDVGKLILACSLPAEFQRAAGDHSRPVLEVEREAFGATHAEVGGYLLGLWGLPAPVVEAIALHHAPGESSGTDFSALTAVHVAGCLIDDRSTLDMEYLTRLGLADRLPAWRLAVEGLSQSDLNHN
jgi:HD-like signal output (HDOD) protein